MTEQDREGSTVWREKELTIHSSVPKCLQQPGLSQVKAMARNLVESHTLEHLPPMMHIIGNLGQGIRARNSSRGPGIFTDVLFPWTSDLREISSRFFTIWMLKLCQWTCASFTLKFLGLSCSTTDHLTTYNLGHLKLVICKIFAHWVMISKGFQILFLIQKKSHPSKPSSVPSGKSECC